MEIPKVGVGENVKGNSNKGEMRIHSKNTLKYVSICILSTSKNKKQVHLVKIHKKMIYNAAD
jgi:hypothetical protein